MAKKILIIEDEKTLSDLMQTQLTHAGYEVVIAEDGEKGIEFAASEKPDMILLDFLLPAKNGTEVLKALRKNKHNIPVLVISNSGQQQDIEDLLALGAKDYLVKANFTPTDVLLKVQAILGDEPTPRVRESAPESAEEVDIPSSKVDIVLIEDDRFLQDLLKKKLSSEKLSVKTAFDGESGLELVRKMQPRLILLDILLPSMDGFEFLSAAKKDPAIKDIPVIVLSNLGQREEIDRAMNLGAADFLIKANFAPDEILKKVKPILEKK